MTAMFGSLLAQQGQPPEGLQAIILLIQLVIVIGTIAGMWGVFAKAGKPGWAAIIPIYNVIVLLEIVGRPVWWIILMLVPCVNIVIFLLVYLDLAKSFGKGAGYGVGLFLLGPIFFPLLGFGDAVYEGPAAAGPAV